MSYRDEGAKVVALERRQDEHAQALARIAALEAELAEARVWLKRRTEVPRVRATTVATWSGFGSLAGSCIGGVLWATLGNPAFIPITTVLGFFFAGLAALGAANEGDGFSKPSPPPEG